ncbi:Bifunctional protein GlmU [bioreactor metagenome]|uniref:Bifunctional protein GlmU n=1 Tax=bioreactor metagenome TaxID=1076179 RepID=A0A645BLX9_9ZZZZ|nr:UDP-N-acetylglucosamine pyrophosphorylase [Christensenella sp.]
MKNQDMFADLSATLAEKLFLETTYPWEVLPMIKGFVRALGATLGAEDYDRPSEEVWIHKTAKIYPYTYIEGPAIIGAGTEVRPGAFIRGSVLVGSGCVVGNSTELKNCILFDKVQVPHYNYVGDSILGHYAHMGAGSICSNVKSDKTLVTVRGGEEPHETGLKKFGAILGDHVEVGCNSVLNPGTVLEPYASVYPLSRVRGVVKAGHIFKAQNDIVKRS